MTNTAITANAHDNGYDIVAGNDITGQVIGRIGWDGQDDEAGLVLHLDGDDETYLPDSADEAAATIRRVTGRELTAESVQDIAQLGS